MHVGDLDATTTLVTRGWTAKVFITVHRANEAARGGAVVTGSWSSGGTGSCTTNSNGRCNIQSVKLSRSLTSVTFTVTGVTRSGWFYVPAANHDPDADSNGTWIVAVKPSTSQSGQPAAAILLAALAPPGVLVQRRRFRR